MKKTILLVFAALFLFTTLSYAVFLGPRGSGGQTAAAVSNTTLDVAAEHACRARNAVWDTAHDAASGDTDEEAGVEMTGGSQYSIHRHCEHFATGADLPDSITVTLAKLRIYPTAINGDANSKTIVACDSSYTGGTDCVNFDDWVTVDSPTEYGELAIGSMTASQWNEIVLNATARSYIATQAASNASISMCLRGEADVDDDSTGLSASEIDHITIDVATNTMELYLEYTE